MQKVYGIQSQTTQTITLTRSPKIGPGSHSPVADLFHAVSSTAL